MEMEIILAFLMIFLISAGSLLGVVFISVKENTLDRILFFLVAFATGTIFATAIFDLIPEALHHMEELLDEGVEIDEITPFVYVMVGFIAFFILERFIYWFHGHAHETDDQYVCHGDMLTENVTGKIKNFAILNLVGDSLHNFLDGIIVMVGFLTSIETGLLITIAVIIHELPQEVGDFGILVYGGFTKKKALLFNLLSALFAVLGGILAVFLSDIIETFNLFFLAFSAGGFIYIAATELMPEMMKERNLKKSAIQTIMFLFGIIFLLILIEILPHSH
jgi:zinc and cadmium transporter